MNLKLVGCGLLLSLAVLTLGCGGSAGPEPPKTHPVTGTVLWKKGEPVRGGLVEFRPTGDNPHTTNAEIGEDGKFTVGTLAGKKRVEGAQEGKYTVVVLITSQDQQNPKTFELPEPFTVKAAGPNELVIDLSKLR